jgi:hypothetical protein
VVKELPALVWFIHLLGIVIGALSAIVVGLLWLLYLVVKGRVKLQ